MEGPLGPGHQLGACLTMAILIAYLALGSLAVAWRLGIGIPASIMMVL